MIDKIIMKLLCLLVCLYVNRKLKNLKIGRSQTMKVTTTLAGFDLSITIKDEKADIQEVSAGLKIGNATTSLEATGAELVDIETIVQNGAKDVRDNFLKPLGANLKELFVHYADRFLDKQDRYEAELREAAKK
jgi:hypothetical protein